MVDELLDIVDKQDKVITSKWRSEIYLDRQQYIIRSVWLFLKNSQGQLWIPRRTAHKELNPLALDGSAVGHVGAGESYEAAIIRETQEELNIDLIQTNFEEIGYIGPQLQEFKAFVKIFELQTNEVPSYNSHDFVEYFWLTPNEIIERIKAGDKAKSYLPKIIKKLYLRQ